MSAFRNVSETFTGITKQVQTTKQLAHLRRNFGESCARHILRYTYLDLADTVRFRLPRQPSFRLVDRIKEASCFSGDKIGQDVSVKSGGVFADRQLEVFAVNVFICCKMYTSVL